jgi:hypothetical protein
MITDVFSLGGIEIFEPVMVIFRNTVPHHLHGAVQQPVLLGESFTEYGNRRGKPSLGKYSGEVPSRLHGA